VAPASSVGAVIVAIFSVSDSAQDEVGMSARWLLGTRQCSGRRWSRWGLCLELRFPSARPTAPATPEPRTARRSTNDLATSFRRAAR
jgi:hypothetical protein